MGFFFALLYPDLLKGTGMTDKNGAWLKANITFLGLSEMDMIELTGKKPDYKASPSPDIIEIIVMLLSDFKEAMEAFTPQMDGDTAVLTLYQDNAAFRESEHNLPSRGGATGSFYRMHNNIMILIGVFYLETEGQKVIYSYR